MQVSPSRHAGQSGAGTRGPPRELRLCNALSEDPSFPPQVRSPNDQRRCGAGLRRGLLGVLLAEALDAARRIDQLGLARVEWVADRADIRVDIRDRRAGLERVATG